MYYTEPVYWKIIIGHDAKDKMQKKKDRYLRDESNACIWPMPGLVQKAEGHLFCDGMRHHY
jgi:hypothetical protein